MESNPLSKFLKLEVILDNPCESYLSGTDVSGCVMIVFSKVTKVQSVKINICGEANVKWFEAEYYHDSAGKAHPVNALYSSSEQFFFYNKCLVKADQFGTFLRGHYAYRFSYGLPITIPSSFEGKYGAVRYICKATIVTPRGSEISFRKFFTVNSIVDLNAEPELHIPTVYGRQKNMCCLCCKSGPLTCNLTIDKSAFVSGETIELKVELNNKSNTEVYLLKAKLLNTTSFFARGHWKYSGCTITKVYSFCRVAEGATEVCHNLKIYVPPLPPSMLPGCSIIGISYCIKLEVCIGGLTTNMNLLIPITIGTIPFCKTFSSFEPSVLPPLSKSWMHLCNKGANPVRHFEIPEVVFKHYPEYPPPCTANDHLGSVVIPFENSTTVGQRYFIPQYLIYKKKD